MSGWGSRTYYTDIGILHGCVAVNSDAYGEPSSVSFLTNVGVWREGKQKVNDSALSKKLNAAIRNHYNHNKQAWLALNPYINDAAFTMNVWYY